MDNLAFEIDLEPLASLDYLGGIEVGVAKLILFEVLGQKMLVGKAGLAAKADLRLAFTCSV